MLVLQQAYEVQESIREYLRATYDFQDTELGKAFYDFVNHPEDGLFRGPFVSLQLPFVSAAANAPVPLGIRPNFPPYRHQLAAFERLSTRNEHTPQPVLLTTGTGSGKTESFLYPLLDYCHRHRERRGIKAIILYPMNALATDQASRIAEAIHTDPLLQGQLTAGLFIGTGGGPQADRTKSMTADRIIEDRETILAAPPDILLTNFKMLDFALMRGNYQSLWTDNLRDPELLRYLVLDELHTYDGAQGTDVANLIRRLKLKLRLQRGTLVPVGTSATIGSGPEAKQLLTEYATRIFGEDIDEDAVIEEVRQTPAQFFGEQPGSNFLPDAEAIDQLVPLRADEEHAGYLARLYKLWRVPSGATTVALGTHLRGLSIFRELVDVFRSEPHGYLTPEQLTERLTQRIDNLHYVKQTRKDASYPVSRMLDSLLALVAESKRPVGKDRTAPLVYLRVQLWIRELSGLQRTVSAQPQFTWRDKTTPHGHALAQMPPYFCRECGGSGWLMSKWDNRNRFEPDINEVYEKFFSRHHNLYFVKPDTPDNEPVELYTPTDQLRVSLHRHLLTYRIDEEAQRDTERFLPIRAVRELDQRGRLTMRCPDCNSDRGMSIIGVRTASLVSIATGQIITSNLDARTERDRKVLAFANGVQDAAHQAGFIMARNYRFTFRTALQRCLNDLPTPMRLSEVLERFPDYWHERTDNLASYVYKFFPSDQEGKVEPRDWLNDKVSRSNLLVRELNHRIGWDILAEFGYSAILGRTLEKTGASAVHFDTERLATVYDEMRPWMKSNMLEDFDRKAFERFLLGLLQRIRLRGGIDHPYLKRFREGRQSRFELNWRRDSTHFLNRYFGKRTRLPRLITTERTDGSDTVDGTRHSNQRNWFHHYLVRCLPDAVLPFNAIINDFYTELFPVLERLEVVNSVNGVKRKTYALRPDGLLVGTQVETAECDHCNSKIHTTPDGAPNMEGVPCLQFRCTGTYQKPKVNQGYSYYQRVYNRTQTPRIYATDHTGLLPRDEREDVERQFRERPDPDSLNVMVATSTLEMGIDIGDLDVGINTSVPPLPANFLQRVGRAGRKSGGALLLNFAGNDAHDQFYFQEPLEMMAGRVHPPGCFLEAREILKRHLLAYCVDRWTGEHSHQHRIPRRFGDLKPSHFSADHADHFFNQLEGYILDNGTTLFEEFRSGFAADEARSEGANLTENLNQLRRDLATGDLAISFRISVLRLVQEYQDLGERRRNINQDIGKRRLKRNDDEYQNLKQQIRNLGAVRRKLFERSLLEQFTNEGLLPNYAFPETGVTLSATVVPPQMDGNSTTNDRRGKELEVVRSARSAIKELTPDQWFFTQGKRVEISGINVVDWNEEVQEMRFCSRCDHLAPASESDRLRCPKCDDPSFGAETNRRDFLQLRTVRAYNKAEDAKISDNSDQRPENANARTTHFDFTTSRLIAAHAIRRLPFGVEFRTQVQIRETNLGPHQPGRKGVSTITIDGVEVSGSGFVTCRHCGRSSAKFREFKNGQSNEKEAGDWHYPYCAKRGQGYPAPGVLEEVFLYRTMTTEAVKILLPISDYESDGEVGLFLAGLDLGLRRFYRGNPQHLAMRPYREYNRQTAQFDTYVVLYDTIPGGTGYLGQLSQPENIGQVLKYAYQSIRDCSCQLRGRDGCYHCVFSYRNKYLREDLSRRRAEDAFYHIVQGLNNWRSEPNGLGAITLSGTREESELERRFVRMLRRYVQLDDPRKRGWSFTDQNNELGEREYLLTVSSETGPRSYHVRPQVSLGPAQRIRLSTRPDFLIEPQTGFADEADMPRIAVYLDGYLYHASSEHPRFFGDVEKRTAVDAASGYLSWTLTHADLENFRPLLTGDTAEPDDLGRTLMEHAIYVKTLQKFVGKHFKVPRCWERASNSMLRLLALLETDFTSTQQTARVHLAAQRQLANFPYIIQEATLYNLLRQLAESPEPPERINDKRGYFYADRLTCTEAHYAVRLGAAVCFLDPVRGSFRLAQLATGFDKNTWYTFWQLRNLTALAASDWRIEHEGEALTLTNLPEQQQSNSTEDTESVIAEVLTYYDPPYRELIERLIELNAAEFNPQELEGAFILTDANERVVAEAVLGSAKARLVTGVFDDVAGKRAFEREGYRTVLPEEFLSIYAKTMEL